MVLSRNIVGGLFKYNDYYSAFGEKAEPLLIDELFDREISADTIGSAYTIPRDKVLAIQEKLIDSFPFGAWKICTVDTIKNCHFYAESDLIFVENKLLCIRYIAIVHRLWVDC